MLRIFEEENKIGPQPANSFPVTVDVTALYTSIPAEGDEGGLQAFEKAMDQRPDQTVPAWFLMLLLQEVLLGNIFEFRDKLWRQVIGTAMGTRVAPAYACLFMHWLEDTKLLGKWNGTRPHLLEKVHR